MSRISHAALTIGIAEADITPPVGVANRCWGAAEHDVASGVHRRLRACVWVIGAEPSTVLIGMDGSWWQGGRREAACRRAIADAVATTPEQVLLCLSHSHSAVPLVDDVDPGPGSDLLARYLDQLPEQLAAISRRAAADRRPGVLQAVYGSCTLAACRDQQQSDDASWAVGHDPEGVADQTVALLRVTGSEGELRGLLVNYACHPTSLAWQNSLLSPDYVGALREQLEQTYAVPLLFLQGAGGDLAPAWQYSDDPTVADRNGECLAYSVRSALSSLPPAGQSLRCEQIVTSGADLGCWRPAAAALDDTYQVKPQQAGLSWRSDFESAEQLAAAIADAASCSAGPALERLRRRQRLRGEFGDGETLALNAWSARFGEILFFGTPGECYSQMQIDLRNHYKDHIVLVVNHCNGGSGYLLPQVLHRRRGFYPAWQSPMAAGSFEQLQAVFTGLGDELLASTTKQERQAC